MIKRVLIDLSTQRDFLAPDGAMPVINHEHLIPRLRRAIAWARLTGTPVVSALDAHRTNEGFNGTPRHCIEGSPGQCKIPHTLLSNRILLEADNSFSVPVEVFRKHHQIILRKRTKDFLGNPKAERLLTEASVGEYVILGIGLESSIKALALGLLARNKRVAVVFDACGYWNPNAADLALRQLEAKGIRLISLEELAAMRRRKPTRARRQRPPTNGEADIPTPALIRAKLAALGGGSC